MNSKQGLSAVITVVLFSLAVAGRIDAAGNIHLGKLAIHPYLSLQVIFSDNVYQTTAEQKRDRIAQVSPGVQLQFPFGVHTFEADYHSVLRRYDAYRGENTDDHHGRGVFDLYFGSRLALQLSNQFAKDHEERGVSSTGFIDVYRTNTAAARATYQLAGRSKVQIDYRQTTYNFMIANFRDRDEAFVAGYMYYRFMPKTSVFIEYSHKVVNFIPDSTPLDNAMDYVLFGLSWEATEKSKGRIRVGQVAKDFELSAVEDVDKTVLFVDLDHKFTEYTSLLLAAKRDVNEANYLGTAFYFTTGLSAEIKHRFGAKLTGLARLSFGKDEFSNPVPPQTSTRSDRTLREGAGLKYAIKDWFEVGAEYHYRSRTSNIAVHDYREHQSVISVTMVF